MNFLNHKGFHINKNILSTNEIEKIKEELTITPKSMNNEDMDSYDLFTETENYLIVPKLYGIKKYKYEDKLKITPIDVNFICKMREKQIEVSNILMNYLNESNNALLNVKCGFGKSNVALYIISLLKVKTLIIVNKSCLMEQWKNRILECYKIEPERIGIIKQDKIEIEGRDIVIGMVQSISLREYNDEIFKNFSLIIYDEYHHYSSPCFAKRLFRLVGKYTLGLSATPFRLDKTSSYDYFIGTVDTAYRELININHFVDVKIIKYKSDDEKHKLEIPFSFRNHKYEVSIPLSINNLIEVNERCNFIVKMIIEIIKKYDQRKILIIGGRINFLELLKNKVDRALNKLIEKNILDNDEIKTFLYIGKMKTHERTEAENMCDILFASQQIASEGLDIPRLNTIILTTPQKNVEQVTGRIMRTILETYDQEINPLIIDIVDQLGAFINQGYHRLRYYKQNKYNYSQYNILEQKLIKNFDENDIILPFSNLFKKGLAINDNEIKDQKENNIDSSYDARDF